MIADSCWLAVLFLLGLGWLICAWRYHHHLSARSAALTHNVQRLLKPRTPDDCPVCRQQEPVCAVPPALHPPVRPWQDIKSRRGAPQRIDTQGFACLTPTCDHYRVMDAQVHALVGDGTHGKHERIQTFRCQACQTTFSARRDTPLYRLKTPAQRVGEVLTALASANSRHVFCYVRSLPELKLLC